MEGSMETCNNNSSSQPDGMDTNTSIRSKVNSEDSEVHLRKTSFLGFQEHLSNLSNAKKKELSEWKEKGRQAIKELKQKVKEEVKQYELKEAARSHHREQRERHRSTLDQPFDHSKDLGIGGWVLTPSQMRFLSEKPYIYNASAGSYLEMLCLQRFWLWLATFIPNFIAPSCITLAGLIINIACCVSLLYYSFDLKSEAPAWTFALCAFGVFAYQTLDALDGKQSFKLQNSPIEEVYDHACDAVSNVMVCLAIGIAAQLGYNPYLLYVFFLVTLLAFYSTHWTAHVTHTMVFGKVDVSEGQWTLIIAHALTAWYGQKMWQKVIFTFLGLDVTLAQIIVVSSVGSLVRAILNNFQMATMGKKTPLEEVGIEIPRRKTTFGPVIPLAILVSFTNICYLTYFSVSPSVFMLTFGLLFAKLTMTLVVVNISKGDMEPIDSSLVVPVLLALNSVFPLVSPVTALLCGLVYSMMDATRFFTYASWDLRVALDANIFSIKYPVGHPKNRAGDNGFYINGLNTEKVINEWKKFKESHGDSLSDFFHSD